MSGTLADYKAVMIYYALCIKDEVFTCFLLENGTEIVLIGLGFVVGFVISSIPSLDIYRFESLS